MTSENDAWKRISAVLCREFELEPGEITKEARLGEDLGLDSLDGVDMVVALEKEFGVKVGNNEDFREVRTCGDLLALVEQRLAGNAEGGGK